MKLFRVLLIASSCLLSITGLHAAPKAAAAAKSDPLLSTLQHELQRASTELAKTQPAPYYLSYTVRDQDAAIVAASQGAIISALQVHARLGDVVTRIGSSTLDNSHNSSRGSTLLSGGLPLGNDEDALTRALWKL